jgi:hypothetical protein
MQTQQGQVIVYEPGDALPPDWPADDPNDATAWRAQAVSNSTATYADLQRGGFTGWVHS